MRRNFQPFAPVTLRHLEDHFQLDEGTARERNILHEATGAKTAAPWTPCVRWFWKFAGRLEKPFRQVC